MPDGFRWNGNPGGHGNRRGAERAEGRKVERGEAAEDLRGPGALEGEAQEVRGEVGEALPAQVAMDPLDDPGSWARVAHAQVPVRSKAREDHVIQDPAALVEEVRVPGAPGGGGDVVRREAVHEVGGPGPLEEELAHVAHVEQPGRPPDGEVLLHDPRVLEGHVPPAELDDPRAVRRVPLKEGGP